jgi:hypothetical protein
MELNKKMEYKEGHDDKITLHIKKMCGEMFSISYDKNKDSIKDLLESELNYNVNGYIFNIFKNNDSRYIEEIEDQGDLNDGDEICIIIYPKTFSTTIIYIDEIFVGDSISIIGDLNDNAEKYLLSIKQTNSLTNEIDWHEFYFYYDRIRKTYIEYHNIDDYIDSCFDDKYYFNSFEDMVKNFLDDTYYDQSICDTILEDTIRCWNN